jgi:hypothetical protein
MPENETSPTAADLVPDAGVAVKAFEWIQAMYGFGKPDKFQAAL